jgi:hypothetical protein
MKTGSKVVWNRKIVLLNLVHTYLKQQNTCFKFVLLLGRRRTGVIGGLEVILPLRGGRFWLGRNPRIALRFIRGYFHLLPPGGKAMS